MFDLSDEFSSGYSLTLIALTLLFFAGGWLLAMRVKRDWPAIFANIELAVGDILWFLHSAVFFSVAYFLVFLQAGVIFPSLLQDYSTPLLISAVALGYLTAILLVGRPRPRKSK